MWWVQQPFADGVDLLVGALKGAVRSDHEVGLRHLIPRRHLRVNPFPRISLAQAVAGHQPLQLTGGLAASNDDSVEVGISTRLVQQWDGGDTDCRLAPLFEVSKPSVERRTHMRMHDCLKGRPLASVAEYTLCDAGAVQLSIWLKDVGPKPASDLLRCRLTRAHDLTGQLVCIDRG